MGHNYVVYLQKLSLNNPNLYLVIIKGHNCVVYLQKLTCNNPNLDLVNVNAYAKFGQILSIFSQDIEQKGNSDDNYGP